jgi:undecaprenyl-phosphate 4-deoxy-4-formamido-L-arabinose transferase
MNPDLSAVISCYFEEESIEEFHERLNGTLRALGRSYEIIFVNDGSTDGTLEKLRRIFERNESVRAVIDLFRNSGQQAAVTAGLSYASGKAILLMDSDLQLAPEEIPLLIREYDRGNDVVSGCRVKRRDPFYRRASSYFANMIMRRASGSTFTDFGCTFKIYNGQLIRACGLGPYHVFSNVELISMAQRLAEVPVSHSARKFRTSGWTLAKLWRYNMDNLVKMSERPFQLLAAICFGVAGLFVLRVLLGLVSQFRILGEVTNGLVLNAIVISELAVIAVLCLIGEFTIRNFIASERLPRYVIRDTLERVRATAERG